MQLIIMNYESLIENLMDTEPAVFGAAVISPKGDLVYQTENWDLSQELGSLVNAITEAKQPNGQNPGRLEIMKITYMIVEFTPERIIATNIARKGHIIVAIDRGGALVTFIDPQKGPRDVLFNVQNFARQIQ